MILSTMKGVIVPVRYQNKFALRSDARCPSLPWHQAFHQVVHPQVINERTQLASAVDLPNELSDNVDYSQTSSFGKKSL